jgi:hypothetical protein
MTFRLLSLRAQDASLSLSCLRSDYRVSMTILPEAPRKIPFSCRCANSSSVTRVPMRAVITPANIKRASSSSPSCFSHGTTESGNDVRGGGIYAQGGDLLRGSTITGNGVYSTTEVSLHTGAVGGGLYVAGGPLYIRSSTISYNYASAQGALTIGKFRPQYNSSQSLVAIVESTISDNRSPAGAVLIRGYPVTITNTTIAFNHGSGAFYVANPVTDSVSITSTIVAQNDVSGSTHQLDNFAVIAGSGNLFASSNGQIPADTISACPLLAPLRDNGGPTLTHALMSNSPAIDHGNTSSGDQPFDQRGLPRVSGGNADIGAYELQKNEIIFTSNFDGC